MLKNSISNLALILKSCKKEFKMIFSDSAVVMSYMLSIMLVGFFYSYVYSHETFDDLPVAIVDYDHTSLSQKLSTMIDATPELELTYSANSLDAGKMLFNEGKVKGVIVIPKDFGRDIQNGASPNVVAYADASYMLYYKQVLGAVMTTVGTLSAQIEVNKTMASSVPMEQAIAIRRPFNVTTVALYNIHDGYATFLMPVVFIIALQTLQITGMGILGGTMRERSTLLLNFGFANTRFGAFFATIGRSLSYLVISMILLFIEILVVMHIFSFPQRGNLFEIFLFLIPVILAITFLGMTMVNFFRKREDAIMTITVFSIPALMVSGLSWPTVAFPLWIKGFSLLIPSTLGVKGFVSLSQFGASLADIQDVYIQMWLVALLYFILAVWTNRRLMKVESKKLEVKE